MTLQHVHRPLLLDGAPGADLSALRSEVGAQADRLAATPAPSVTDKAAPGPSGDLHDFSAIGKYAWPDPEHPEGPWIRRDCHFNPDSYGPEFDKARWDAMQVRARLLAVATACLDPRYATALAETVQTWFVDPQTRMKPHFRYAAALPGVWDGHAIGIIEGAALVELLGWVDLAREAVPADADLDRAARGLADWMAEYRTWLLTSEFGRTERGLTANNHGTWAYAQVLAAELAGAQAPDVEEVRSVFGALLEEQMRPDGGLTAELDRDDAWHYSLYGMRGFGTLAQLGEAIGADLWGLETEGGASMRLGYRFLTPFLVGAEPWPYTRMTHTVNTSIDRYAYLVAAFGAAQLDDADLRRAVPTLVSHPNVPAELRLLAASQERAQAAQ